MDIRVGNYGVRTASIGLVIYKVGIVQEGGRGRQPSPENIGKETETVLGHYGKLEQALKFILQEELRECEAISFKELYDHIETVLQRIENACTGITMKKVNDE